MQYIPVNYKTQSISLNQDGSATFLIKVITGIVGDTYEFYRGDDTSVTITNYASKLGSVLKTELDSAALAFVQNKYPNT